MKKKICYILLFCVFSAVSFYLMEAYEHNPFVQVRGTAQLFNILLFELIGWIFYFLLGRLHWAMRLELFISMLFGLVNHYVMLFRSTPFVPWDIFSVGTAVTVTDNYDFTPGPRVIVVSLGFVALMILARVMREQKRLDARYRFPAAAVVLAALVIFTSMLQNEEFQIRNRLYPFLFTPAYMTQVNGMAVTFAMNLEYLAIKKPDGYDEDEMRALLAEYGNPPYADGGEDSGGPEPVNIIVVMDEAFSDLAVLGDFETNMDYMPYFHELQCGAENTVTGYAQVSVCGGNTANSEYEFLTGNTMAFLPGGSIPYQQYINGETPSIASHLRELGYATYAQHPYHAGGWERNEVYPLLGFEDTDFIDEYEPKEYVRKYVSDACDFRHIIQTYEAREPGKPVFIFNVTMQNHGAYSESFDNFLPEVEADCGSDALNRYLSLIRLSDESLRALITYFSGVDERTIILFFGDHQPNDSLVRPIQRANGVDTANLTDEERALRYQVPYLIWANYDIPEQEQELTSLNYLGGHLLRLAGVTTSAYQNYLMELEKTYPVISAVGRRVAEGCGEDEDRLKEQYLTYQRLAYYMAGF